MLIFLYGPDTYRSRQKLGEIIKEYRKLYKSGLNFKYLNCAKLKFQEFNDEIRQTSMFKEKKMIILTNSFSNTDFKEKFREQGKFFADSNNIIIFYEEGQISKKDSFFTFLKKQAKAQEFKLLKGIKLKNWVKEEFKKLGAKIGDGALDKLIFFVNNNLWQMATEIKKLSTFAVDKEIRVNDIELLVKPKIESDIFKTIDAIASRDKNRALKLLKDHLEKGDSPLYLFSMINFQFRNLLVIKDLIMRNFSSFSSSDLHPFIIRKSSFLARKFEISELKKIYQKIFEVDLAIKTGKIEPEAALELLIVEMANWLTKMGVKNDILALSKSKDVLKIDYLPVELAINNNLRPITRRIAIGSNIMTWGDLLGLGLVDSVRLVGKLPYEKMEKVYCSSDLVVQPSLWHEPISRTIFDAFNLGIPFVGFDVFEELQVGWDTDEFLL